MTKKKVAEKGEPEVITKCDNHEIILNHDELITSVALSNMEFPKEMHDMFQKIAEPTEKDMERRKRYKFEYERLMDSFQRMISKDDWINRA